MRRTRLIHDHVVDPDNEYDFHQWCLLGEPIRADRPSGSSHDHDYRGRHYLDSLGRPNGGSTAWLTMRCNNTDCPAVAIVNESWLIEQAAADLPPLPTEEA